METYVKISLISIFSPCFWFFIMILSYTLILPMSQLQTQQLMTSQIESHPTVCLYSLRVLLRSDNGTYKTGCSSNRTNRRHSSLALLISCVQPLCSVSCWIAVWLSTNTVIQSCNFHAKAIRHIRHILSTDLALTLACSLILTRLDYCNSVLYSAPVSSIHTLQRVQNNAARIVLQAPRRSHAKPLMRQLHWLPVQHRINYKVSVLTYKTLDTSVPQYLSQPSTAASTHGHYARRLRHRSSNRSLVPASRNVLFDPPPK